MKKYKKIIFNFLFIVVLFGFTAYGVLRNQDLSEIQKCIHSAKKFYLILSFVFVFIFVACESLIIHRLFNTLNYKTKLCTCLRYSFVGFFVSYITPSASGGQPAQMYFMNKDSIPLSVSTIVLMVVTVAYKLVLLILGIGYIIISHRFVFNSIGATYPLVVLGVFLNVIVVLALLTVIFKPKLAKKTIANIIIALSKMHLIKNRTKVLGKALKGINKYEDSSTYFKNHKVIFFRVFFITIFQRVILFCIPFLVYKSFGLSGTSAYKIIILQTVIAIAVENLPLPGGVGATEGLYYIYFADIFGASLIAPSLLLTRGISFYFLIIFGGVITIFSYFRKPIKTPS